MKILRSITLLLILLPSLALAHPLKPFTANYDVKFSGLGGELTSTLSKTDSGEYIFENRTRAKGIARLARPRDVVERSTFTRNAAGLRPLQFQSEDGTRRNTRGNIVSFDWESGVARSDYEEQAVDLELEKQTLDRQLMQLAMMSDLSAGVRNKTYTVIDRHDLKRYQVTVLDEETVTVPAGTYEALKVRRQRPGSSRATIMWCAPALGYLPVSMQQLKDGDVIGELKLTAYDQNN